MERQNVVGNFLEHSLEELQARCRRADLCGSCLRLGIPDYFKGDHPEFETIAQRRIDAHMKVPA